MTVFKKKNDEAKVLRSIPHTTVFGRALDGLGAHNDESMYISLYHLYISLSLNVCVCISLFVSMCVIVFEIVHEIE